MVGIGMVGGGETFASVTCNPLEKIEAVLLMDFKLNRG